MEQGKPFSATESPLVDFDAVCSQVRAAVEPARAHAVSLHDENGDLLWLSESSMGPDEHNAVREALESFARPDSPSALAFDLGDARSAVLIRAVNAHRALVGAIMLIMDTRAIKDARGPGRLLTPKLQRALVSFAVMRPAAEPITAAPVAKPRAAVAPKAPPVPPAQTAPRASPPQVSDKHAPAVPPEIDRLHAALRRSPIALHVQRLVPLTKGSHSRRYEVLLRSKSDDAPNAAPQAMLKAAVDNGLGSMIDRRVITELVGWLVHHPDVLQSNAAMFSVNLTATALHDEHFIKFVGLCLAKSSLPKATIGFEIDVATAVKHSARIAQVTASLHRLGCPVVLDDFALKTECFELLRLPGIRYVKLAPDITAKMRTDKIAQAAITAIVQMARVLGMHTVAKRTETTAEQEWLTALGVDFVQSHAMSPPVAIESLSRTPKAG